MIKSFLSLFLAVSMFYSAQGQTKQEMDPAVKSGIQKFDAKNYQGALQDFSGAITKFKAEEDKYLKSRVEYDKLSDYQKAMVENNDLFEARTDLAIPYYYRAVCQLNLQNKAEAMKDLDKALVLDSKYTLAIYQRGKLKIENGDKENGCIEIRLAADLGSEAAKELYEENFCWNASFNYAKQGTTNFTLGKYDEAINDFNLAIKLNPDSGSNFIKRGMCYYAQGKFDKAIADYTKAISRDSIRAEGWYRRGLCYYSLEKHQQAFTDLSFAIQKDNNYVDAFLYRAYACEGLANTKSAIYDYGQVIRLKPNDGLAYFKRGLLKQDSDKKTACKDFKQAVVLGYDDAAEYAASCK